MHVTANGARLFVHTIDGRTPGTPEAPTLVALHSGLGWDHSYLVPWLAALAAGRRLVFPDLRGSGRSEQPQYWSSISFDTWTADLEALRETLALGKVVLFGHGFGSFVALEFALRFPEALAGLVLCATAPAIDYLPVALGLAKARSTDEQFAATSQMLSGAVDSDEQLKTIMETILPIYLYEAGSLLSDTIMHDVHFRAAALRHSLGPVLTEFDVSDRLGQIRVPTLVLAGGTDWIAPPREGGARVHAGIPGSRLEIFERSGHFPFAEEPERFRRVMLDWMPKGLSGG